MTNPKPDAQIVREALNLPLEHPSDAAIRMQKDALAALARMDERLVPELPINWFYQEVRQGTSGWYCRIKYVVGKRKIDGLCQIGNSIHEACANAIKAIEQKEK